MEKTSSGTKVVGILGLATGVAAAAAGYYFFGKDGKEHRKEVSNWKKKAKMEMLEKIKQMESVTQTAYHKAAEEVLAKYKLVKDIDPKELQNFGQELRAHWEEISKQAAKLSGKSHSKKIKAKI